MRTRVTMGRILFIAVLAALFLLPNQGAFVRAQGGPTNLALNKPATQSSTYVDGAGFAAVAGLAVDGNTSGIWADRSISHTLNDAQAWWQVDLQAVQSISTIDIWNRTDYGSSRLSAFYVFVSDNPFTSTDVNATISQSGVSSYYTPGQAGTPTTISVNRTGRYVRLQLTGTNYLHPAEIQVWSGSGGAPTNTPGPTFTPSPTTVGPTLTPTATPAAWLLSGNSATNPGTNFLGTTDNQPLVVKTNGAEAVRVNTAGSLGIGSTTPLGGVYVRNRGSTADRTDISLDTTSVDFRRRSLRFLRDGILRYALDVDNAAELGGNSGSIFGLNAYSDTGTYLRNVFAIRRNDGAVLWFSNDANAMMAIGATDVTAGSKLTIRSSVGLALRAQSITNSTTGVQSALKSQAVSAGDMVDGFGPQMLLSIQDNAGVDNDIAAVGALRAGADNNGSLLLSTSNGGAPTEKMRIMPDGKVGIGTTAPGSALTVAGVVESTSGGIKFPDGTIQTTAAGGPSDRNLKANFEAVDGPAVLARLATLPVQTWNYKSDDVSIRHMGPMAQDFYAAFGVGRDDKYINSVDADGVQMAAIQALYQTVQEQKVELTTLETESAAQREQIANLQAQVTHQQERNDALEARLAVLEQAGQSRANATANEGASLPMGWPWWGLLVLVGLVTVQRFRRPRS